MVTKSLGRYSPSTLLEALLVGPTIDRTSGPSATTMNVRPRTPTPVWFPKRNLIYTAQTASSNPIPTAACNKMPHQNRNPLTLDEDTT